MEESTMITCHSHVPNALCVDVHHCFNSLGTAEGVLQFLALLPSKRHLCMHHCQKSTHSLMRAGSTGGMSWFLTSPPCSNACGKSHARAGKWYHEFCYHFLLCYMWTVPQPKLRIGPRRGPWTFQPLPSSLGKWVCTCIATWTEDKFFSFLRMTAITYTRSPWQHQTSPKWCLSIGPQLPELEGSHNGIPQPLLWTTHLFLFLHGHQR